MGLGTFWENTANKRALAGSMLVNFIVGFFFVYGNINGYAYIHLKDHNEGLKQSQLLMVLPIWLICQSGITTVGLKLAQRFGFRRVIVWAGCGFCLVNLIVSYIKNYIVFIIVYGMGCGCWNGLGYLLSLYIAWTYYPAKKGLITGLMLFATGACPAILSPVTTMLANPNSLDEPLPEDVRFMFRMIAAIFGVTILIVFIIIPPPFKSMELLRRKVDEQFSRRNSDAVSQLSSEKGKMKDEADSIVHREIHVQSEEAMNTNFDEDDKEKLSKWVNMVSDSESFHGSEDHWEIDDLPESLQKTKQKKTSKRVTYDNVLLHIDQSPLVVKKKNKGINEFMNYQDGLNDPKNQSDEGQMYKYGKNRARATQVYDVTPNVRMITQEFIVNTQELNIKKLAFLEKKRLFTQIGMTGAPFAMDLVRGMTDDYIDNMYAIETERFIKTKLIEIQEASTVRPVWERESTEYASEDNIGSPGKKSESNKLSKLSRNFENLDKKSKILTLIDFKIGGDPLPKIQEGDEYVKEECLLQKKDSEIIDEHRLDELMKEIRLNQWPDLKTGFKSSQYKLLVLMAFNSTIYNYFMNAWWKDFAGIRLGFTDDSELSLILTMAAIFEAFSGLIVGYFITKFDFKKVYLFTITIQITALLTIYTYANNYGMITLNVALSMYLLGSDKTFFPTVTQQIFGSEVGPKIYPFVYIFFSMASLGQFILYNYVFESYSTEEKFKMIFIIFTVWAGVSWFSCIFLNPKPDWKSINLARQNTL